MTKSYKAKVLAVLAEKPLRTSDLIAACGYDPMTVNSTVGCDPVRKTWGWRGSPYQKALAKLVDEDKVRWRRDRKGDVWYKLRGQRFPRVSGPMRRTLPTMVRCIYKLLDGVASREPLKDLNEVALWHEFLSTDLEESVVLLQGDDEWKLCDGDPVCFWAFNTFTEHYPFDTAPEVLADRIKYELTVGQPKKTREFNQRI